MEEHRFSYIHDLHPMFLWVPWRFAMDQSFILWWIPCWVDSIMQHPFFSLFCCMKIMKTVKLAKRLDLGKAHPMFFVVLLSSWPCHVATPGIKRNATASVCLSKWVLSQWPRSCLGPDVVGKRGGRNRGVPVDGWFPRRSRMTYIYKYIYIHTWTCLNIEIYIKKGFVNPH